MARAPGPEAAPWTSLDGLIARSAQRLARLIEELLDPTGATARAQAAPAPEIAHAGEVPVAIEPATA